LLQALSSSQTVPAVGKRRPASAARHQSDDDKRCFKKLEARAVAAEQRAEAATKSSSHYRKALAKHERNESMLTAKLAVAQRQAAAEKKARAAAEHALQKLEYHLGENARFHVNKGRKKRSESNAEVRAGCVRRTDVLAPAQGSCRVLRQAGDEPNQAH
jgi:hypothetical protein